MRQEGEDKRELGAYRTAALAKTESPYPAAWRLYRRRRRLHKAAGYFGIGSVMLAAVHMRAAELGLIFFAPLGLMLGAFLWFWSRGPFPCPRCATDWDLFWRGARQLQCPHCQLRYGEDPDA